MNSTPKVQYAYDDTAESGELVKGLRPTQLIYPNGRIVRYEYAQDSSSSGAGDDPDDCLNRIKLIADDDEGAVGTHLAEYTRLGLDSIVQVDYTEPQIRYDLAHGAGDDPYDGLDRFGRVADLLWHNYNTSEDVVRIKHGYDRAGNRLYRDDSVAASYGVDMDEAYTYDGLYQLKTFTRGALNAQKTAIAAPTFRQAWDFDTTGNWAQFREDKDGDGQWDLDQTRTHNPANEITAIDASIGDIWISPTHDRNGNTLRIPQPNDPTKQFTLKWDAWNRLVKVCNADTTIAEYAYDARNFRVVKNMLEDGASSQRRDFYHDEKWRCVEERVEGSPDVTRHFVFGPRYVDDIILCEEGPGDKPAEVDAERLYTLQDGKWNIAAIMGSDGATRERYLCDPFGASVALNWSYARRGESVCGVRCVYSGRLCEPETELAYYRSRWGCAQLGRFAQRDTSATDAGVHNAYLFVLNRPTQLVDPLGLREFFPDLDDMFIPAMVMIRLPNGERVGTRCMSPRHFRQGRDFPASEGPPYITPLRGAAKESCESFVDSLLAEPQLASRVGEFNRIRRSPQRNPFCWAELKYQCVCCLGPYRGLGGQFIPISNTVQVCYEPHGPEGMGETLLHEITHGIQFCRNDPLRNCLEVMRAELEAYRAEGRTFASAFSAAVWSSCMVEMCQPEEITANLAARMWGHWNRLEMRDNRND